LDARAAALLDEADALARGGDLAGAEARYRAALDADPALDAAWAGLGRIAHRARRRTDAVAAFARAAELAPGRAEHAVALGAALVAADRASDAIAVLERAAVLAPRRAEPWIQLASACQRSGDPDRAIDALERALALAPDHAAALNNLGNLLKETGRAAEAIVAYERALAVEPSLAVAASNRLSTLKLLSDRSPEAILAEHRAWARGVEAALAPRPAVRPGTDRADRPLKVGYLSPDAHTALPPFLRAVWAAHDPAAFSVCAYFNNPQRAESDPVLAARVARRVLAGLDDARAAALIAADDLDLLVDLAGHTGHNRLPVFVHRPARVALTWLDYLSTTGMRAIDFRITDAVADPTGAESAHSERLLRLPVPAWCWTPPADAPPVAPLPLLAREAPSGGGERCSLRGDRPSPTFGSFNHALKLTDATLALWRPLFDALPRARLVAVGLPPGRVRARVRDALGLDDARIACLPRLDDTGYRAAIGGVDVALDPTPFSGAATTLDALWQGVPVVTRPGPWSGSRSTASLLAGIGADEWVAGDDAAFVAIASALVADASRLASIRASLRVRVASSSIARPGLFVPHLEAAYRRAWDAYTSGALVADDL
jgi:predicted O-linked N-acetylglucosamine transferase (SPINDLY family)